MLLNFYINKYSDLGGVFCRHCSAEKERRNKIITCLDDVYFEKLKKYGGR